MTSPPTPGPGTQVRTDRALLALWCGLMGPGGFAAPTLWIIMLDHDDRLLPTIVPIDDLPAAPDEPTLRSLAFVLGEIVGSGDVAGAAFLLARPGTRSMVEADRVWARAIREHLGHLTARPVHLATRDHVQVFAPDDLLAAS